MSLKEHLNGKTNPVEDYFFNGHTMNYVGPCSFCGYESFSIIHFAFFELNFEESPGYSRHAAAELIPMMDSYFKKTSVSARCKN